MDTELRGEAEWCRHTIEMPAVTREAVKGLAPEIGSIVCRHLKGIGCDGALMGFVKPDPVLPEVGGGGGLSGVLGHCSTFVSFRTYPGPAVPEVRPGLHASIGPGAA